MVSPTTIQHVYDTDALRWLMKALQKADAAMLAHGRSVYAASANRNVWIDAAAWMACFSELVPPTDRQFLVLWSGPLKVRARAMLLAVDRATGIAADGPATRAHPMMPDDVATFRMSLGLRQGEKPPGPSSINWKPLQGILLSSHPEALFQRAWLERCADSLLLTGDWWNHVLLASGPATLPLPLHAAATWDTPAAGQAASMAASDQGEGVSFESRRLGGLFASEIGPDWERFHPDCWPQHWGVTMQTDITLFDNTDFGLAPRTNAALDAVGASTCSLVEYFTVRYSVEVYRHRHWMIDGVTRAYERLSLARIPDPFDGDFCGFHASH